MAVNIKTKQTYNPITNDLSNYKVNDRKIILTFLLKFLFKIKLVFY